jgi:hypothetical protein
MSPFFAFLKLFIPLSLENCINFGIGSLPVKLADAEPE